MVFGICKFWGKFHSIKYRMSGKPNELIVCEYHKDVVLMITKKEFSQSMKNLVICCVSLLGFNERHFEWIREEKGYVKVSLRVAMAIATNTTITP